MEKTPFRIEELTAGQPESLIAQGRELLLEYGRFVMSQQGVARFCFGTLEKEAAGLPESYIEQGGGCLLAHAIRHAGGIRGVAGSARDGGARCMGVEAVVGADARAVDLAWGAP